MYYVIYKIRFLIKIIINNNPSLNEKRHNKCIWKSTQRDVEM